MQLLLIFKSQEIDSGDEKKKLLIFFLFNIFFTTFIFFLNETPEFFSSL